MKRPSYCNAARRLKCVGRCPSSPWLRQTAGVRKCRQPHLGHWPEVSYLPRYLTIEAFTFPSDLKKSGLLRFPKTIELERR